MIVVVSASAIGLPTTQQMVEKTKANKKLKSGPAAATIILSSGLIGGKSEPLTPALPSTASIVAICGSNTNPPAGIQPKLNSTPPIVRFKIGRPNQTPNLFTYKTRQ